MPGIINNQDTLSLRVVIIDDALDNPRNSLRNKDQFMKMRSKYSRGP